MTMIGDENEGAIIDWIIDNLPNRISYGDLDITRKGNWSIKHE